MAGKCTPPLNFVPNGPPGQLPIAAPDPTPPTIPNSPTFSQQACELLGADLCSGMDPISSIDDLTALADSIDGLAAAQDANLDAILLELDTLVGQQPINDAFDAFAGAQPGATSLLGDVTSIALPAAGQIPMVLPNGAATITFGGAPEWGGPVKVGAAAYTLRLQVLRGAPGGTAPVVQNLTGPNPPFVGVEVGAGPMVLETAPDGLQYWVAPILINPMQAGQFTAVLYYKITGTIAGFTGTFQRTLPFEVVVTSG